MSVWSLGGVILCRLCRESFHPKSETFRSAPALALVLTEKYRRSAFASFPNMRCDLYASSPCHTGNERPDAPYTVGEVSRQITMKA